MPILLSGKILFTLSNYLEMKNIYSMYFIGGSKISFQRGNFSPHAGEFFPTPQIIEIATGREKQERPELQEKQKNQKCQ